MSKHRRPPPPKVSKRPPADNPDPGIMMERLYGDLVELEGIAITADECVTALPVFPNLARRAVGRTALHDRERSVRDRLHGVFDRDL